MGIEKKMKKYYSTDKYHSDYYRMTGEKYKPNIKSFIRRCLFHNLQFAFCFRRYQENHSFLYRVMLYRLSRKYGLEISPNVQIGEGLYIGHPYNITVGEDVILGNNINLHKGCTIGRTNRGNMGSPVLGDCVFIGINATVVGNIHIGNDVLIAPNSYVNTDIPDHSVVIGNPAVVYPKEKATENYICYTV